ncbi:MAG: heme NO-binding domain-containing protein [Magnetococcus sp. WYHC-3]
MLHGLMFLALESYLDEQGGEDLWSQVRDLGHVLRDSYSPTELYPRDEFEQLLIAAAATLNQTAAQLEWDLGRYMAPGLLEMARTQSLIPEHWRTLDIFENLPVVAQRLAASQGLSAEREVFRALRLKYSEVALGFFSDLGRCRFLEGVIVGLGEVFAEPIAIVHPVCRTHGAPFCRLSILLDDPLLRRKVDVQREFRRLVESKRRARLYLSHRGLPVDGEGMVVALGRDSVALKTENALWPALKGVQNLHLALPHLPVGLSADVVQADADARTVKLGNLQLADGAIGRRSAERYAPDSEIMVDLVQGDNHYPARLRDLSRSGASLDLDLESHPGEDALFAEVGLSFKLPLRWIEEGGQTRFGSQDVMMDANILDLRDLEEGGVARVVFAAMSPVMAGRVDRYFQELLERSRL